MKIYIDHNATTPPDAEVLEAVARIIGEPHNPSSVHYMGRNARKLIEDSRTKIASSINAKDARIIFTSSGTEANNLAIKAFKQVAISAIEHSSILKIAKNHIILPVDPNGILEMESIKANLASISSPFLVSVMMANNETGVIQNIEEISRLVHGMGGFLHIDACQAFGKITVDFRLLDADIMTISAHKMGGIHGAAALIFKKNIPISPQIIGGGQESSYRAGTENIPAIVGFGVASSLIPQKISRMKEIQILRDYMESNLHNAIIFSQNVARLPNTSNIAMMNVENQTQLIKFDMANIAVSSGSACSSGKIATSHVLEAMGADEKIAKNAIRVSLGYHTQQEEIDYFIEKWLAINISNSNTNPLKTSY